jgi:membrane-associated protease RseP (regulator of RpoE activity)
MASAQAAALRLPLATRVATVAAAVLATVVPAAAVVWVLAALPAGPEALPIFRPHLGRFAAAVAAERVTELHQVAAEAAPFTLSLAIRSRSDRRQALPVSAGLTSVAAEAKGATVCSVAEPAAEPAEWC